MGYTNYWKPKTRKPKPEILSEDFRADIRRIVAVANENNIKCHMEERTDYIVVHDEEHHSESFYLDTKKNDIGDCYGFNCYTFCKTCACPFDAVVKCCIVAAIQNDLFDSILSFDGNKSDEEYTNALDLAKKIDPEFAKFFESIPVED